MIRTKYYSTGIFLIIILLSSVNAYAHTINYALEKAPANEVIWFYTVLGIRHIVPDGLDHILFVVGLCLLNPGIKSILWQATAFTIAHSITLLLSIKNIVVAPAGIIEPIISLSIFFIAIENIIFKKLHAWRIIIVFLFGLIHGMGFASSLNEIGLPRNKFITSIISFNAGVEIGQLMIIALTFVVLIIPFSHRIWFRKYIVYPVSGVIAVTAILWTFQRIF